MAFTIQEYKDTGLIIQSIAQLRNVFAVGKKYKLYADFKLKTFDHAVNEISRQYKNMKLHYTEIKAVGKKIVAIQFNFNPILPRVGGSVNIDLLSRLQ